MNSSIKNKIWQIFAVSAATFLCFALLLFWQSSQINQAKKRIEHTYKVLRELNQYSELMQAAESSQRGFVITQDKNFLNPYEVARQGHEIHIKNLIVLTADNSSHQEMIKLLEIKGSRRLAILDKIVSQTKEGRVTEALATIKNGIGKTAMDDFLFLRDIIVIREKSLLTERTEVAETQQKIGIILSILGGIVSFLILLFGSFRISNRIGKPLIYLETAIANIETGNNHIPLIIKGNDEISNVLKAFNKMSNHLKNAEAIREINELKINQANTELALIAEDNKYRSISFDLLGRMAHRLQAASSDSEFADVVAKFAPRILPNLGGALYLYNNSRNLVTLAGSWSIHYKLVEYFEPDDCWALRRGQEHRVDNTNEDVICSHLGEAKDRPYTCKPLLAQGEIIGLLYLDGKSNDTLDERLSILAENLSLAVVNHRLRMRLREQSIRDPLTGLFNRRYLEESLHLELARAHRIGSSIGVIMCDVDHFKKFNDTFGHDAGDAVLRSVASAIQTTVREGDVVCRYGGEEITIVLPEASESITFDRAEAVRKAVEVLSLTHHGESLGRITLSAGIAIYPTHGQDNNAIISAADSALYKAKQNGRNRVESV